MNILETPLSVIKSNSTTNHKTGRTVGLNVLTMTAATVEGMKVSDHHISFKIIIKCHILLKGHYINTFEAP